MRIGAFAKHNRVSIDTIRHYMELGLILPQKHGGQYTFEERCQIDLDNVIELKNMGFSLNEIKTIFKFKRLGKLTPYQKDDYYRALYIDKHEELKEEIAILKDQKEKLEIKINELSEKESIKDFKLGIDIKMIELLACSKCNSELVLHDGIINDNQIMDGKLECRQCGEFYYIESGILKISNADMDKELKFQQDYFTYIREYINVTDSSYLDNINKGLEWLYKKINFSEMKGKVLLDLGSGVGFFLRYIYQDLPDDCYYIAVDHDINRHKFLKNMLERTGCKKKIVFIEVDFLEIPLKRCSVDILIDHSGTSNYSFHHSDFLLSRINHYVKEHAKLLGSYILFKNFSTNSIIEADFRKNFMIETVKEKIFELGYEALGEHISEYVEKGGKYEGYFVKGEKVYNLMVHCER
ncbi:MerR family transcriptional regulator [Alkaliphilus transvaalensis]|uniref:MerR family transcriptional regulator n=1 Tax=Alkaliphilus transvaalensis TaxID=114628 RepID=UPI00047CD030|nr:MerR family transcriptional regulator [Alkaliphilus transvaalensis]